MDLISHLYMHYTRISPTDMEANNKILRAPYNTKDPFKSLIERLNKCADFASAAWDLVSETQLLSIAYGLLAETGQHPEDFWA